MVSNNKIKINTGPSNQRVKDRARTIKPALSTTSSTGSCSTGGPKFGNRPKGTKISKPNQCHNGRYVYDDDPITYNGGPKFGGRPKGLQFPDPNQSHNDRYFDDDDDTTTYNGGRPKGVKFPELNQSYNDKNESYFEADSFASKRMVGRYFDGTTSYKGKCVAEETIGELYDRLLRGD